MNRSRRRDRRKPGSTVWADKLYDTADFVAGCRERGCTRRSRRTTPIAAARRSMAARPAGYAISMIKPKADRRSLRLDVDDGLTATAFRERHLLFAYPARFRDDVNFLHTYQRSQRICPLTAPSSVAPISTSMHSAASSIRACR